MKPQSAEPLDPSDSPPLDDPAAVDPKRHADIVADVMTPHEVCEEFPFLAKSTKALGMQRLRKTGPPYLKMDGRYLYLRSRILRYLEQSEVDPKKGREIVAE